MCPGNKSDREINPHERKSNHKFEFKFKDFLIDTFTYNLYHLILEKGPPCKRSNSMSWSMLVRVMKPISSSRLPSQANISWRPLALLPYPAYSALGPRMPTCNREPGMGKYESRLELGNGRRRHYHKEDTSTTLFHAKGNAHSKFVGELSLISSK